MLCRYNQNQTDIDVWVTEPRGEKCYYGNKSTQISGRISKNITQGYGPEQFMLKKAIKGKYIIETNFFGETQLKTSGPTTIMSEIYLYYSYGREERQILTLQDAKSNRGNSGVYIGEFNF